MSEPMRMIKESVCPLAPFSFLVRYYISLWKGRAGGNNSEARYEDLQKERHHSNPATWTTCFHSCTNLEWIEIRTQTAGMRSASENPLQYFTSFGKYSWFSHDFTAAMLVFLKQRNVGHVAVPTQSSGNWTLSYENVFFWWLLIAWVKSKNHVITPSLIYFELIVVYIVYQVTRN